jgi:hypothetical protein
VALALLEDEIGALTGRQDVLVEIAKIDARPDRGRGLDRIPVGSLDGTPPRPPNRIRISGSRAFSQNLNI